METKMAAAGAVILLGLVITTVAVLCNRDARRGLVTVVERSSVFDVLFWNGVFQTVLSMFGL